MILKLCKPFRNAHNSCGVYGKAQGYHEGHLANDFYSFWGDTLLAPENVKIVNIIDEGMTSPEDWGTYDAGFGILMASIENPQRTYSFWHCRCAFPVNIGDVVLKGQPVAYQGNSGYVISGGVVIKGEARNTPQHPGTHVHITAKDENGPFDFSERVDWDTEPPYDIQARIKATQLTIIKILNYLIKGRATN
jgi:hypothetical protein